MSERDGTPSDNMSGWRESFASSRVHSGTNSPGQSGDGTPAHSVGDAPTQSPTILSGQSPDSFPGTSDANSPSDARVARAKHSATDVHAYYLQLRRSAALASQYAINPTSAIPIQSTHINALAVSKGLKYLFLGGSDGYVRKYDLAATLNGQLSLTILQRHSLVDSVVNAGVLMNYWENEIPQHKYELVGKNRNEYSPKVSTVHSLAVESESKFLLSGLQNGGISVQSARFLEGTVAHYFKPATMNSPNSGHSAVVNQLQLNTAEDRFLSGGWDKQVFEWDIRKAARSIRFEGVGSEVSTVSYRPAYASVEIFAVDDEQDEMGSLFGDDDEEERWNYQQQNLISEKTLNLVYDDNVFLSSGLNGSVFVWDRRKPQSPSLQLTRGAGIPPWCLSACWGANGDTIFVGRRNACVEEFDVRNPSVPKNTLKLPTISGPVSCVKALPNGKHVLCASIDNIRLFDTSTMKPNKTPFLIVPGHHGGTISNLYLDPTCRFLISTSGDRGWQGTSTDTTLIYEVDIE